MEEMEFVIIRTIKGSRYASYIDKEINITGKRCGVTEIKNLNEFLKKNKCDPKSTLIHVRTAHPDRVYKVLKNLSKKGYRIINSSEAIRLTSDKLESCFYAEKNKIPCAKTVTISKKMAIPFIRKKIDEWGDVIVKPRTSQGQGEYCFKFNKRNINHLDRVKKIPSPDFVVQKFLEYERLNRVLVIGYKALDKAVFWDKPGQGWKCSVCLNPNLKTYGKPPQKLLKFAEDIAKKFKAEISFIDIFSTPKGYVLNEINTACNFVIHERKSRINISRKIAEYLLKMQKKKAH